MTDGVQVNSPKAMLVDDNLLFSLVFTYDSTMQE